MPQEPTLPNPAKGDPIAHTDITRLSDALKLFRREVNERLPEGGVAARALSRADIFLGRVRSDSAGAPAGIYKLDRLVFPPAQPATGLLAPAPDPFGVLPSPIFATNLAELSPAIPPAATGHSVNAGQIVLVVRSVSLVSGAPVSLGAPGAGGGQSVYYFYHGSLSTVLVKPAAVAAGAGIYTGFVWAPPSPGAGRLDTTADLTEAMLGIQGDYCIILNRREVNAPSGTHALDLTGAHQPLIFEGLLLGAQSDGTNVYSVDGVQDDPCP